MIHSNSIHSSAYQQAQEYLAGWQRERADFANFRRETTNAQHTALRHHQRVLVEPLLALADNFSSIVQHVPPELREHSWAVGVTHVARQLEMVLAGYHVKKIDALGSAFDPSRHEAVATVKKNGVNKGEVVEVLQSGYMLGDTVLRAAKVKIAD